LTSTAFIASLVALWLWPAWSASELVEGREARKTAEGFSRDYPTLRALVVAHGDCIVSEYYRRDIAPDTRSPVYSVTKSLLSILVGIAIDAGYLRLEQKLGDIFPEAAEAPVDPRVRDITVRDLLTMTSGFDSAPSGGIGVQPGALWRWMLERPMRHPPGTHFVNNDASVNLLSVALARSVHEEMARFASRSLFEPLGIEDVAWVSDAEGNLIADTGLRLTAREMAKIDLLYLRNGQWRGKPIVSDTYVRDSTTKHNDGGSPVRASYGYLWWVGFTRDNLATFFAAGHDSQLILVVPERDLVVAVAAEGLPEGSRRFVDEAVLPVSASLSSSAPCAGRLQ
jgi:CubicO group peptidase (beta-lactamase class C family)